MEPRTEHLHIVRREGKDVAARGNALVFQLVRSFKLLSIHNTDNEVFRENLVELSRLLSSSLAEDGRALVRVVKDYIYYNDVRLRMDVHFMENYQALVRAFRRLHIGGFRANPGVNDEELKRFFDHCKAAPPASDEDLERFLDDLRRIGVVNVEIEPLRQADLDTVEIDRQRRAAAETYARGLEVLRESLHDIHMKKVVNLRRVKRAIQMIVRQIFNDEFSMLGLTTLRQFSSYIFNHSLNVCILAIAMGQRLGLSKRELSELGTAAVFFDIGMMNIPREILEKPEPLTPEERAIVERHPIESVKMMLSLKSIDAILDPGYIKALTVAFQHHRNFDGSGYPDGDTMLRPSLYARIIALADRFDAMTTPRGYRARALSPVEALEQMRARAGAELDPVLFKVFINLMGVYPVGTLVLLDTRELAVVFRTSGIPEEMHRPKVRLICDKDGNRLYGRIVDLAKRRADGHGYERTIVKSLDPHALGIDVSQYFLAPSS